MLFKSKQILFLTTGLLAGNLCADTAPSEDDRLACLESESAALGVVEPNLKAKNTFYVSGDYLLWHAYEPGLAYAVKTFGADISEGTVERAETKNIRFGLDSGFRLGVGYRMPHDKWELGVQWTRFYTTAEGKASAPVELLPSGLLAELLYPEWTSAVYADPLGGQATTNMKGTLDLHLNLIDGEAARYFMVTPKLALRPHGGIRGARISQSYKILTKGGQFNGDSLIENRIHMSDVFKGVGLRGGLDTEWDLCDQWSLFGNAGGSLIYGSFVMRQVERDLTVGSPDFITYFDARDRFHQVCASLDLALGIRWHYTFCDQWGALRLQAGWELNEFFGQNKFKHFDSISSNGTYNYTQDNEDLTLQGLTVSGRFDF